MNANKKIKIKIKNGKKPKPICMKGFNYWDANIKL